MKTSFYLTLLVSVLLACQPQNSDSIVSVVDASDDATLRNLKTVLWPQAYAEQDTVLLDRIMHDKFQLVDDQGGTYSKTDEMSYIAQYPPSYDTFQFDIDRLDVYENGTAVISGKGTLRGTDDDGGYITTYRSSNSLVKVDGQWKMINSHVSGVDETRE